MYKEYTQKRQKFVVFIAVSSEYRCIQPQNNRLKIIYPCMKVGSLHMGLTDKTVLLSLCCPVKNKLQHRESSRMDTEESMGNHNFHP